MKTSELTGAALDWAVSEALGLDWYQPEYGEAQAAYSTDWAQGGPIIEREKMTVGKQVHKSDWSAESFNGEGIDVAHIGFGPTPLIAAMRCYVASKLGDEVEIPEELK
jgi:hypothetical protein